MSVTFYTDAAVESELDVNMSNVNARRVLGLLGFGDEEDMCGSESAASFQGRVLTALALTPYDSGVPSTERPSAGGMTWIDCGRPEGYLQQRLGQLHELAASTTGEIHWA